MTTTAEAAPGRASGPRIRHPRALVPPPLAALIGVVLLIGVSWALLLPPFQAPDEAAHFAYVQSLAERGALPGDAHRSVVSTDQVLADGAVGAGQIAFHSSVVKPPWNATDQARYLGLVRDGHISRSDGGGTISSSPNPPLYYLYAALAYWAADSNSAFDRLYAIRIWGVVALLGTVVGAWLLAGEVLGRRRLPQLACAAIAGLVPEQTFISTSVNPDALMVPLWTVALWLGARVVNRGAPRRDALALSAVTAAAIVTKATSYALVPAVLLALAIGYRRRPASDRGTFVGALGPPLLALAVPVLGWIGLARALGRPAINTIGPAVGVTPRPFNIREFLSFVWQFYLPRLPWMTPFKETGGLPVYSLWLRDTWGFFGWNEFAVAGWLRNALAWLTATAGCLAAVVLIRNHIRRRIELLAFFALALGSLLLLLHITSYRSIITGGGPFLQGRYLLPVIGLAGLVAGLLVARVPGRWRGAACGGLVAGLLVLQVLSLATVARQYFT
jgi:4-amino-4-deoxy-L-arabinose transferase-like glycosyltransferase